MENTKETQDILEAIAHAVSFNDFSDMELESALLIAEDVVDDLRIAGFTIVKNTPCKYYSCGKKD
jgi:hypothetical protein